MNVSIERIVYGDDNQSVFWGSAPNDTESRYVANRVLPRCPVAGECWALEYSEEIHPEFGRQRRVTAGLPQRPSGTYIPHLLSKHPAFRGLGVGSVTATNLYAAHGSELANILADGRAEALVGINGDIAFALCERWQALDLETSVICWLDERGLEPRIASKLLSIYGATAVSVMEENPYSLLPFLDFATIDKAARTKMGMLARDPRRMVACVENVLYEALANGHTAMRRDELCGKLTSILSDLAGRAVDLALEQGVVFAKGEYIQACAPALMERELEDWLAKAMEPNPQREMALGDDSLSELLGRLGEGDSLSLEQQQAVLGALSGRIYCIAGGAGVGKTTVLRMLAKLIGALGGSACFMAISGRATRRIAASLGDELAKQCTIKTVAGYLQFVARSLPRNATPWLIVDEASMLDLQNAYRIIDRSPKQSRLVLVGDPHQLPPVGPGLIFQRLADVPSMGMELTRIFRQAEATGIPQAARSIRGGNWPNLDQFERTGVGIQFQPATADNTVKEAIRIRDILAQGGGEVQVLTLFRGAGGADEINSEMHARVNPNIPRIVYPVEMAVGEPVIFGKNDPEIDLQNGSTGVVIAVGDDFATIRWDDGVERRMERDSLWHCALAHAITTHKSQGSQYERVVVVVPRSSVVLDRTLLYTAITRAKQQAVLVGDMMAVRNAIEAATNADKRTVLFSAPPCCLSY